MITILVLFSVLLVMAFIVAVLTGILAVSPLLVLILALPLLDYFCIKCICKKKKK